MKIEQHVPTGILRPFIKTFMIIESENGMVNRVIPDTSLVAAFRLRGMVTSVDDGIGHRLPASVISGIRRSSRLLDYAEDSATLLVQFNEGCAAAFFRESLHELAGASVSLDDLIDRRKVNELEEQLAEAKNNSQRISIVERFMLSELSAPGTDHLIRKAVEGIRTAKGNIRIKDLLHIIPLSRDAFEKRFRRVVGTSPKQFAAIVRLRHLIDTYPRRRSLTDAALAAGYFDQAHFIKDFTSFTGQTPKLFFESPAQW